MGSNECIPRIAFNAHLMAAEQSYRSAGLSMYIAQLVQHLDEHPDAYTMDVYVGRGVDLQVSHFGLKHSKLDTQSPARRILWEQLCQPWQLLRGRYDLVHGPAFVNPVLSPCKRVVTIHDLSFIRYPQYFRTGNRLYLNALTRISCKTADMVITGTEFAANEIQDVYGIPRSKIRVIPHGVDARFKPMDLQQINDFRQEKHLPEKYILFLGTLEPRKNLVRLVKAFAQADLGDVTLVIAGGKGWYYEDVFAEVQKLDMQSKVRFTGYIPASELALWYNAAWAFAYISVYEGFGLPVLEALACGLPVLASSTTSLPEASGGHAVSVDPLDVKAIADGLRSIVYDSALRQTLSTDGLAFAAQFTWKRAAQETAAVYFEVLDINGQENNN